MRSIILVLCLVVTNAFCQSPLTEWALKFYNSVHPLNGTSIPPLNRTIIHEADKLINKKVGKGLCGEFVLEVLSKSKVPIITPKKPSKVYIDDHWKEITDSNAIYPGDIIIFFNHIAIIYAKLSPSEYTIIDQNSSGRRKYSHVGFEYIKFGNGYFPEIYRITL